jgi:hypothetical protein
MYCSYLRNAAATFTLILDMPAKEKLDKTFSLPIFHTETFRSIGGLELQLHR